MRFRLSRDVPCQCSTSCSRVIRVLDLLAASKCTERPMASTSKIRGVEVLASSCVQGECKTMCLKGQDQIIRLHCHIAVVYNAKNNLCAGLFSQVVFFLLPLQCVLDWRNKQSLSQAGLAHLENNVLITIPSPWNPSPFQPEPGSLSFEATLCRVPRCYIAKPCFAGTTSGEGSCAVHSAADAPHRPGLDRRSGFSENHSVPGPCCSFRAVAISSLFHFKLLSYVVNVVYPHGS